MKTHQHVFPRHAQTFSLVDVEDRNPSCPPPTPMVARKNNDVSVFFSSGLVMRPDDDVIVLVTSGMVVRPSGDVVILVTSELSFSSRAIRRCCSSLLFLSFFLPAFRLLLTWSTPPQMCLARVCCPAFLARSATSRSLALAI